MQDRVGVGLADVVDVDDTVENTDRVLQDERDEREREREIEYVRDRHILSLSSRAARYHGLSP